MPWCATPISRFMPPRMPGAASIASTSRRCTAKQPSARCSRTTSARRSSAASCGSPISRSCAPRARRSAGFEALVRWAAPGARPISPDKFIPLAEEGGLIAAIGDWVLETALEEAAHWPDHVRIAVNLSPIQFNDPSVVEIVAEHLNANGVRADRLELEITEGVFLAEGDFDRRDLRPAEDARRAPCARRFRHRLQLARLFEESAVRQDQDRPELRSRRRLRRPAATAAIIRAIVTLADSSAWTPAPKASRPTTTSS